MPAILNTLLDTDLYKFTMMQCIFHHFNDAKATYQFKCRNAVNLAFLREGIQEQLRYLEKLRWKKEELDYLTRLPYFKKDYINFLKNFTFKKEHVNIGVEENELSIVIEGPWVETILFEVPLLAIISELYNASVAKPSTLLEARRRLKQKINYLQTLQEPQFGFTDFGTRRRFSKAWHLELIQTLQKWVPHFFLGTSNVWMAKIFDLPVKGTMAHEFLQAFQVLAPNFQTSQKYALEIWYEEYHELLSIALTDTLTMDIFLREFDASLAKKYQGLRQDSGDPIAWGNKALNHYKKLGIPTQDKTFVFSDRLTIQKAHQIFLTFKDFVYPTFGIGTNLTHDTEVKALDIVIKLTKINDKPVVKISDSPGKEVFEDARYLLMVKESLGLA